MKMTDAQNTDNETRARSEPELHIVRKKSLLLVHSVLELKNRSK